MITRIYNAATGAGLISRAVVPAIKESGKRLVILTTARAVWECNWSRHFPDSAYVTPMMWLRGDWQRDDILLVVDCLSWTQYDLVRATLHSTDGEVWLINPLGETLTKPRRPKCEPSRPN
ncbi:hypothetical protein P6F34_gp33 [Pseudomonas phage MiCath]|uniref:Uncharacterized protein n=1 Tax=Pseudomonas phage MiCath TaxID=3003729 RepID=A0AAE9VDW4_9CAUD|nr:hypothetical protein P6F34_gp33 [Pseudomonas phage MiCath]WAX22385.1 hypothetical protein [Pseudomonas phage MiCath]